jgi:nucleotide-binding universal stress UspA family protein
MRKILVPTDFSRASKAGLRFAIQLATQINVEPVFYHCFSALVPTTVRRASIVEAIDEQTEVYRHKLEKFVAEVHRSMHILPGAFRCVVEEGATPHRAIVDYVRLHNFKLICMSMRGGSVLRKLLGTQTQRVIATSPVPVLVIPYTYRTQPIRKLLYASDLEDVGEELPAVADFAEEVGARVELVHFYGADTVKNGRKMQADWWRLQYPRLDRVLLEPFEPGEPLENQLDRLVKKERPDLVVYFTRPNRTWFDRLFSDSRAEAFAYGTRVPLLVYRKATIRSPLVITP